jgi:hypothetical protein
MGAMGGGYRILVCADAFSDGVTASQLKKVILKVRSPFSFAMCVYLANGSLAEVWQTQADAKNWL